ncbi:GNAT family N-acetyltransferase [Streptomyces profundus]|uniref:GNAT family N-acetyltransferase n=1 Tax=Streptomyces profundus TaxID=2867410 RepID=UPI001D16AEF5|nr:GNAT family N-acetyltransferase [Streptomyces sp. MA3_2.13]UED84733.1 GNAT family N-acetyltransferase [Streptomyces sp. MA3_2.13]
MVTLKVLTTDDAPLWLALRRAALTDAPCAFRARLADWDVGEEERWRARLALPGAHHLAALLDGRPVGTASGLPGAAGVRELRSLWVDSAARGLGVGGRLIEAVETWALESGGATLRLTVLAGNEPAIARYLRHGFTATGRPGAALPDGRAGEQAMAKVLRPGPARAER